MELLKALYSIHSRSGEEKKMKKFIRKHVELVCPEVSIKYDNKGNMYITKGVSETYPCVVAHLDQVQDHHSKDFMVLEVEGTLMGYSPSRRQQEGLGGDDKNGIWIALNLLCEFEAIKVAFFVGEEIGCAGSSEADMTFFTDCRFVIQPDRRDSSDLITNISGMSLCSQEFKDDIRFADFGYKEESGLMTDVETLLDNGLGLSCINLSCGYYNPHTDYETTDWDDLNNCLNFVRSIVMNCTKVYKHKPEYSYGRYGYGNYGGVLSKYGYGYGSYGYGSHGHYGDYDDRDSYDDYYSSAMPSGKTEDTTAKDVETEDPEVENAFVYYHLSDYYDYTGWLYDILYDNLLRGYSAVQIWSMIASDCDGVEVSMDEFMWFAADVREQLIADGFSDCLYKGTVAMS